MYLDVYLDGSQAIENFVAAGAGKKEAVGNLTITGAVSQSAFDKLYHRILSVEGTVSFLNLTKEMASPVTGVGSFFKNITCNGGIKFINAPAITWPDHFNRGQDGHGNPMPDNMTHIKGDFVFDRCNMAFSGNDGWYKRLFFSGIKRVDGDFIITNFHQILNETSGMALEYVGGNFEISFPVGHGRDRSYEFGFLNLKEVGGNIYVDGFSTENKTKWQSLTFLASIEKIGGSVKIINLPHVNISGKGKHPYGWCYVRYLIDKGIIDYPKQTVEIGNQPGMKLSNLGGCSDGVHPDNPPKPLPGPIDFTKTRALSANKFLASIGVNSAIYRRGEDIDNTIACCKYLGARWIRVAGAANSASTIDKIKKLYDHAKVKVSFGLGSGGTDINGVISGSATVADFGALLAIEGCNEPNNWDVTYNGEQGGKSHSWLPVAKLHRDLYLAVKNHPVLRHYPVWSTTETGAQTDNCGLQFLEIPKIANTLMPIGTKYADYANCHNYFSHPSFLAIKDNQTWRAADPSSNSPVDGLYGNFGNTWLKHFSGYDESQLLNLPKVTTETGINLSGSITEEVQALMYMSTYLAQFKRGWSHTAMYILRDRSDEGGNQSFGFYKADYSPRLAAHYLHNLTTILSDHGEHLETQDLEYSILNQQETVHDLLLQKSDGTMMLVVWGENFTGSRTNITIKFKKSLENIKIYNPTQGAEAIKNLSSTDEVSLVITNHPFVLQLE
ncbi:hypothetical protein [Oceanisphaera avium]|uniref:Glycosyl hydrolase n=1 Tax=Oceanisphaera avium TaxID=1903694 RepID=A0A1Y0D199_9GAMM|nr:hypothetical protein [Oceanisphaera avium]ART80885.1 hypothetical protein CBP12_12570 [Oceanisphaera avium]